MAPGEALSRGPALAEGQGHGLFTAASGAQPWARPSVFWGRGSCFSHGAQREVPVGHTGALATRHPSSPWEAVFWCPPDEDAARGEVSHHRAPGTHLASPFGPRQSITKKTQAALHNHVSFRLDSGPEVSWPPHWPPGLCSETPHSTQRDAPQAPRGGGRAEPACAHLPARPLRGVHSRHTF